MIRIPAQDTALCSDGVWMVDSAPVGCGRFRETAKRSDLAGWAEYGYCASHPRYFWGLRLHLGCTLGGLPVLLALTGAEADERETPCDMLDTAPDVVACHPGHLDESSRCPPEGRASRRPALVDKAEDRPRPCSHDFATAADTRPGLHEAGTKQDSLV